MTITATSDGMPDPQVLSPDRLAAAVEAGILSEHQADQLTEFWVMPQGSEVSGLTHADREEVRFVRGFHDIFISIGLVVLMFGLVFGLHGWVDDWLVAGISAAVIWGLAELFARRKRLALPSFLLSIAFTPFFFIACVGWFLGGDMPSLDSNKWLPAGDLLDVIPATVLVIIGAVLFYLRFRVPVGVASISAGCLFLGALLFDLAVPGIIESNLAAFFLVVGLSIFALAMGFDSRDPKRITLNSDKAFWLHLMASPLIVHSILSMVSEASGTESTSYSAVVIALFLILATVALIVDRRALLVSAMSYLGFAIGYLIIQADVSEETAIAVTMLVLGCFILLIGSAWQVLRRGLLKPFADTPLLRFVPAPN